MEIKILIKKIDEFQNESDFDIILLNHVYKIQNNYFIKSVYNANYRIIIYPRYAKYFHFDKNKFRLYISVNGDIYPLANVNFNYYSNSRMLKNIEIFV